MRTLSGGLASLSLIALAALAPASLEAQGSAIGVATPQDVGSAAVAQLEPMSLESAFPGLSLPRMVHLTHAGDGSDRLWAVLQHGRVVVFPNDRAASSAQVFLDIEDRVVFGGEQGLLGLAFDPDYASNGYFYVNYTAANPLRTVISRFSVSGEVADRAVPESELVMLEVTQPFSNHNGGTLAFGPDGYLYIGLGDGGSGGDPFNHGQNTSTLLGAVLRIDVSGATVAEPYRVPADNPFVGVGAGARAEIWAFGLRNPWKFSFDHATEALWAGDVGQNNYEEVDIVEWGGNYGWNVMEGLHCYPPGVQACDQNGLEPPVLEYTHAEGCSITGGYVYRGSRLPSLAGAYVYADYCSGRIWGLRHDGTAVTEHRLIADTDLQISSFGTDERGNLYVLAFDGHIYRFAAPAPPATPVPAVGIWGLLALAALLTTAMLWRPTPPRPRGA